MREEVEVACERKKERLFGVPAIVLFYLFFVFFLFPKLARARELLPPRV